MRKLVYLLLSSAVVLGGLMWLAPWHPRKSAGPATPHEKPLPTVVDDFRLTDHLGRSHELYRYADFKAVVLFVAGNGCPIVRQSIPKLKELRDQYAAQVAFLLINSNPQDDRAAVQKEADAYGIDMPILMDDTGLILESLGARRTAEALVVTPGDWKIRYRGAVDDRFEYGTQKAAASQEWLKDALDAVLQGRSVATPLTKAKGCAIQLPDSSTEISYVQQVAPLVRQRCVPCHSEGNVAPFAFGSYKDVHGWAPMMREVIRTKRMPPWHAAAAFEPFANDRSLSTAETQTLIHWIDAGASRDMGPDPLEASLPPAPAWPLGEPDVVVAMPEPKSLPAEGVFPYQYVEVPSPLQEDAWLRGADVQPGNRRVVHHVLVFVKYPGDLEAQQPNWHGGLAGYFAGYVPGAASEFLPPNTGKFLPKGACLMFQLHYNATGKPETDLTRLGLYFCKEKPATEISTRAAFNRSFQIPPGAKDYEVTASFRVDQDSLLWGMSPHMHYRGSRFRYEAQYPDGTRETLVSVPYYDFNWQTMYQFKQPKKLPAGTTIQCTGAFDNSASNPANPDAAKTVNFGEQTFDEMFIGYLNLSPLPKAS